MAEPAALDMTPEELSKSLVRDEYEKLVAQSDYFGWDLRLHDAGDYYVIFVRIEKSTDRIFVLKLEGDDYSQIAPRSTFIDPALFETADETTEPDASVYPKGDQIVFDRGPLPVLCIKGHRDYYAPPPPPAWHGGWTDPPAHDHGLYQHVVNVRNALLEKWS